MVNVSKERGEGEKEENETGTGEIQWGDQESSGDLSWENLLDKRADLFNRESEARVRVCVCRLCLM